MHPRLKKLACLATFQVVALDAGEKRGRHCHHSLGRRLVWIIPLTPEKVSVGCVLDQAGLRD